MVGDGIVALAFLHDDSSPMSEPASTVQSRGEAAFAICEAAALAERTQALLTALLGRLAAFANDPSPLRQLGAHDLEQVSTMSEDVSELSSQIALIVDGLPLAAITVAEPEIAEAACAALADGIVDQRRALTAASFLTAAEGFPALSAAFVDTDAHAYWTVRVVDMLSAFRDVDETRARQMAALAGVSATAPCCELAPERVLELAHTLRRAAAR